MSIYSQSPPKLTMIENIGISIPKSKRAGGSVEPVSRTFQCLPNRAVRSVSFFSQTTCNARGWSRVEDHFKPWEQRQPADAFFSWERDDDFYRDALGLAVVGLVLGAVVTTAPSATPKVLQHTIVSFVSNR
eukprot:2620917-Amphidinium_carterae.2